MPLSGFKASVDDLLEAIKFEHDCMTEECSRLQQELTKVSETLAKKADDGKNTEDTDTDMVGSHTSLDSNAAKQSIQVRLSLDGEEEQSPRSDDSPLAAGRAEQESGKTRKSKRASVDGSASNSSLDLSAVDSIYDLKRYEEEMRRTRQKVQGSLFTELSKATVTQMTTVKVKMMKQKTDLEKLERRAAARGLASLVRTELFSLLSAFLTLSNALYIGIETNAQVQAEMEWYFEREIKPKVDAGAWTTGSLIFVILFLVELIIRVSADGTLFWMGHDRLWNLFDTIVVVTATVELILEYAEEKVGFGVSLLRSLKIVRICRLMRLQREDHASFFSRFIRNLKTMLYSLGGSATAFFSAMVLLVCIMYVFGLMFMQGLPPYLHRDRTKEDVAYKLNKYYGTLDKTLWSLIGSVTGGYDWTLVADPLKEIGVTYVLFFVMYIAFVLLGLLNILNGIFVHASVQAAENNRELAIDRMIGQRQGMMKDMINMFIEADIDKSGTISWSEFEKYMEDDRARAYFEALGLDTSSIWKIFSILDVNKEGELGLGEFVEGCFRLRGPAKVVDLVRIQETFTDVLNQISFLEAHLKKFDNRTKVEMFDVFKAQDVLITSLKASLSRNSTSSIGRLSKLGTPKIMLERSSVSSSREERTFSRDSQASPKKELMRREDEAEMGQVTPAILTRMESADLGRVDSQELRPLDSADVPLRNIDAQFIRASVEASRQAPHFASPAEEYKSIAEPIIAAKACAAQVLSSQDISPAVSNNDRWKPSGIFQPRGPSAASLETEPKQPPWAALSTPLGQARD